VDFRRRQAGSPRHSSLASASNAVRSLSMRFSISLSFERAANFVWSGCLEEEVLCCN
jgi:hypothetical protein